MRAVIMGVVVLLGIGALMLVPVWHLRVLATQMGLAALATWLVMEGLVMLARSLFPVRAKAWAARREPSSPYFMARLFGLELAASAFGLVILIATASSWQPLLGIEPPSWMLAMIALRAATSGLLRASTGRPYALVLSFVELIFVLPLVAMVGGSLSSVVIGATAASTVIAVLALGTKVLTIASRSGRPVIVPAREPRREGAPTQDHRGPGGGPGAWLSGIVGGLPRPLVVCLGGLAAVVPVVAVSVVSSVLYLPFMMVAMVPLRALAWRFVRGVVLAACCVLVIREAGPGIYRALFPDAFGDGAWLRVLGWSGLSVLPISLRGDVAEASERRLATSALLIAALWVALATAHGFEGLLYAMAGAPVIALSIGVSSKQHEPLMKA